MKVCDSSSLAVRASVHLPVGLVVFPSSYEDSLGVGPAEGTDSQAYPGQPSIIQIK